MSFNYMRREVMHGHSGNFAIWNRGPAEEQAEEWVPNILRYRYASSHRELSS
jgi:hypothetical protein